MAQKPYKKPAGQWQSAYNAQPKPPKPPGEWTSAATAYGMGNTSAKPAAAGSTPTASSSQSSTDQTGGQQPDPMLIAQQNAANLSIGLGDAWDTYKGGQIDASYGNLDNPAADAASNPMSQAALAYKRYNESQAGTNTSYAASGHLYSGSLQNATEANASNYGQTLAGLRQSKQGAKDALTIGKVGRYSQVGATLGGDALSSLMRALGQG